jgi:glycyl-tRNA synthetase beta chain
MTAETQNPKIETRNSKAETRKSKLENRNPELGASFEFRVSNFAFLLEVGCEEIPARFLHDAEKGLGERVQAALREARLLPEAEVGAVRDPSPEGFGPQGEPPLQTYSTPRRLIIHVPALLGRQPDKVEEILGPPVKVAVGAEGKYTRAAESFAQKNSSRLEDLTRSITPKGEYLVLRKTTQGRSAQQILPEILPSAILGLSFPKSMYWMEKSDPRFVRPVRWVLAILGEGKQAETVNFEILGVKSGNFTFGHRAKRRQPLRVADFNDYTKKLAQARVEIDPPRRQERVLREAQALLEKASLKLVRDEWLVDWVVSSTEWPRPMLGSFDERFLHLPREILITVMRDHQKYFAVEDGQGNLRPHFVAVLNIDSHEKGLIRQGHDRVLRARFTDAEFFWNADQRMPLRERVPLLDKVTYQAKLGSYGDKVRRMKRVGRGLWAVLYNQQRLTASAESEIMKAIELSKCDLTTQMVQEFPELQGVIGGLYAKEQGESDSVADAIYDHYKPQGANDNCPRSLIGAGVALADKIDAVTSGFVAGLAPTGSSDPFGLRRQANGIVRIIVEFSISDNLMGHVLSVINEFSSSDPTLYMHTQKAKSLAANVVEFIRERVSFYLEETEGLEYDIVRAALGAHEVTWNLGENNPVNIVERARALKQVRATEGFVKLCGAAKRIRNILSKSADSPDSLGCHFDKNLFEREEETSLGEATEKIEQEAQVLAREGKFVPALREITKLVGPVDRFFDSVLVMAENQRIRDNRLKLLNRLNQIFSAIVDLSQVVGE